MEKEKKKEKRREQAGEKGKDMAETVITLTTNMYILTGSTGEIQHKCGQSREWFYSCGPNEHQPRHWSTW